MTEILKVSGLTKVFKLHLLGGKEVVGCEAVSFNLRAGEILGIQGPSGVGKSTVLKCLYRTYLATAGQALYRSSGHIIDLLWAPENDILSLRRQEIGYVSQFLRVVPRV
ncbi:MAG: ATP-binding cassette domain-containing protein, partial [Moorellaceae bacterium]